MISSSIERYLTLHQTTHLLEQTLTPHQRLIQICGLHFSDQKLNEPLTAKLFALLHSNKSSFFIFDICFDNFDMGFVWQTNQSYNSEAGSSGYDHDSFATVWRETN